MGDPPPEVEGPPRTVLTPEERGFARALRSLDPEIGVCEVARRVHNTYRKPKNLSGPGPDAIGRLFSDSISGRLAIGYTVGFLVSVLGVAISYEHSTGPIVVGLLGLCLVVSLGMLFVKRATRPSLACMQLVGGALALCAMLYAFGQVSGHVEHGHDHLEEAVVDHPHEDHHADHADHEQALTADPLTQLDHGVRMVRALDAEGLILLASLTQDAPPFIRMEADDRLRTLAGVTAPDYDPLAGPDSHAVWMAWAKAPGEQWRTQAPDLPLP